MCTYTQSGTVLLSNFNQNMEVNGSSSSTSQESDRNTVFEHDSPISAFQAAYPNIAWYHEDGHLQTYNTEIGMLPLHVTSLGARMHKKAQTVLPQYKNPSALLVDAERVVLVFSKDIIVRGNFTTLQPKLIPNVRPLYSVQQKFCWLDFPFLGIGTNVGYYLTDILGTRNEIQVWNLQIGKLMCDYKLSHYVPLCATFLHIKKIPYSSKCVAVS